MTNTPYANLDPVLILDAVESAGFRCSGSLLPLNSYENRVYQIGIEEAEPLIAKFYRPLRWSNEAIIEEHQFALELLGHEIPVVAPLQDAAGNTLHTYKDFRFALFPRKGGRALELDNLEQLEWMGRFIGRLHAVGATRTFQHRLRLDAQTYGMQPFNFLLENQFIPLELRAEYSALVREVLQKIEEYFASVDGLVYIRVHGDCHAGNVLWNNTGPQIVDLDDCLMAPAVQDIWMLLSGNNEHEYELQLEYILRGYQEFHDFNYAQLRLIAPLRTLRMIHYSAWLAKRWDDPAFPITFPWFNTMQYWREQIQNIRQQAEVLE